MSKRSKKFLAKMLKLMKSFPRESGVRGVKKKDLRSQIESLNELAARSTDPCLTAKFIALSTKSVRRRFLKRSNDGCVLKGIECKDNVGGAEKKHVVFKFEARPGALSLVTPAFVAVVDMIDRQSVKIIDPYLAPPVE